MQHNVKSSKKDHSRGAQRGSRKPVKNDAKICPKFIFAQFWGSQGAWRSKLSEKVCFFWCPLWSPKIFQKSETGSKIDPLEKQYKVTLKWSQQWTQNGPKMEPKLSPKMSPKMKTKMLQKLFKQIRKLFKIDSNMDCVRFASILLLVAFFDRVTS